MDEIVEVLNKILEKLDSINDGIDELHSKLDDMQGIGLYNSISDVHDKLEEIKNTVEQIQVKLYKHSYSHFLKNFQKVGIELCKIS